MFEPPPTDHGNVVDPDVLATRRARRAEVSEDASLELRLFEAERRLGEVAAERDALRATLDGHERDLRSTRQREWAEQQQRLEAQGEAVYRDRRAALEREHKALRAELERRAELADAAVAAIGTARRELAAARDVETRLAAERSAFAAQVAAVETAVAAVRDRLGAAVGALREQLRAERGARRAAEASVAALEAELARRA